MQKCERQPGEPTGRRRSGTRRDGTRARAARKLRPGAASSHRRRRRLAARGPAVFWIVGELAAGADSPEDTAIDILTLTQPDGGPVEATGHATIEEGARTFQGGDCARDALPPDDYVVRARVARRRQREHGNRCLPAHASRSARHRGALLFSRGPATASRRCRPPTAVSAESSTSSSKFLFARATAATARLLDRNGKPRPVPVAVSVREDGDGLQSG